MALLRPLDWCGLRQRAAVQARAAAESACARANLDDEARTRHLVWPDDEASARHSLRLLSAHGSFLAWGGAPEVEATRLRFSVDTNVWRFRTAHAGGRWEEATVLYRHNFLSGVTWRDAPEPARGEGRFGQEATGTPEGQGRLARDLAGLGGPDPCGSEGGDKEQKAHANQADDDCRPDLSAARLVQVPMIAARSALQHCNLASPDFIAHLQSVPGVNDPQRCLLREAPQSHRIVDHVRTMLRAENRKAQRREALKVRGLDPRSP
ncbi:hypothetical protein [Deinococcus hopiensis]|uniref:hypothetical protein n=1 Tax=Deinococcus hopiensis TaxID=309885 RepID=UPI00111C490E|nr:hypothetical protein [Deinococcus hopiensis]